MPDEEPAFDPVAAEYKNRLQNNIERMEIEYDKALLALNPAAITVSIALYNQLIAATKVPNDTLPLHIAWGWWLFGTICTLFSFLLSKIALQEALAKYEEGQLDTSNYNNVWHQATGVLNWASGAGFLFGLISAAFFFQ
jgi:hypothetical protein